MVLACGFFFIVEVSCWFDLQGLKNGWQSFQTVCGDVGRPLYNYDLQFSLQAMLFVMHIFQGFFIVVALSQEPPELAAVFWQFTTGSTIFQLMNASKHQYDMPLFVLL